MIDITCFKGITAKHQSDAFLRHCMGRGVKRLKVLGCYSYARRAKLDTEPCDIREETVIDYCFGRPQSGEAETNDSVELFLNWMRVSKEFVRRFIEVRLGKSRACYVLERNGTNCVKNLPCPSPWNVRALFLTSTQRARCFRRPNRLPQIATSSFFCGDWPSTSRTSHALPKRTSPHLRASQSTNTRGSIGFESQPAQRSTR